MIGISPPFTMYKVSLLALSLLLLAACNQSPQYPNNNVSFSSSSSISSFISSSSSVSAFTIDANGNFAGTVTVTGYPVIKNVSEAFCETDCTQYEYVYFESITSNSRAFDAFLKQHFGNYYVTNGRIGIGCRANNLLTYWNDSDENGMREATLSQPESKAIFAATPASPVTISLTRLPFTGGSGAPTCYSDITTIKIAQSTAASSASTQAVPF